MTEGNSGTLNFYCYNRRCPNVHSRKIRLKEANNKVSPAFSKGSMTLHPCPIRICVNWFTFTSVRFIGRVMGLSIHSRQIHLNPTF